MRSLALRPVFQAGASAVLAVALNASAQTNGIITFANRQETLTNLEGRVYDRVELVRADLDGIVYRNESGGGRICYTNLSAATLEALGIDTNRIAIAAERASMSAEQRKADYARRMQEAAAKLQEEQLRQQAQAEAAAKAQKAQATPAPTTRAAHRKGRKPPVAPP